MGGTFESVPIRLSADGKTRKQKTHLLSDDEVDELAVLLGIILYSAEDHKIFVTDVTRKMIKGAEYLLKGRTKLYRLSVYCLWVALSILLPSYL